MNYDKLSTEQKYALQKFKQGENLFITGPGGTGKTTLINNLIEYAKNTRKKYQVCALTGCAAVLLNCGARTIHSWSGIRLGRGPKNNIIDSVFRNQKAKRAWKTVDLLIIDEVSMMSLKIFEILDDLGRIMRNRNVPFGGIQIIFTGDFFQLPPVPTIGESDTERFCFESQKWFQAFKSENHVELTTIFRQKDEEYIEILSEIRKGELSEKNIGTLNAYVNRNFEPEKHEGLIPPKIFPLRSRVDQINSLMFSKLDEDEYEFEYSTSKKCRVNTSNGKMLDMDQIEKCNRMSEKEIEYEIDNLVNNTPCNKVLRIKKGAVVMCNVNIDPELKICNGSQGMIMDIIESADGSTKISVKFSSGLVHIFEPHIWQSEEYPCIFIKQYPLSLSWAITIHKVQGATLAMAEIDIGRTIFEYGQTYVALSRIQSLDGLYLSSFVPEKIRANPLVKEFYNGIPKINTDLIKTENPFSDFELKEDDYVPSDKNIKIIKI